MFPSWQQFCKKQASSVLKISLLYIQVLQQLTFFLSKCLPEAFGSHRHPSGFEVDIHRNLTSQGMNLVKRQDFQTSKVSFSQTSEKSSSWNFKPAKYFFRRRKVTEEKLHRDSNCFLMLVIRSKHFFTLSRRSFSILSFSFFQPRNC